MGDLYHLVNLCYYVFLINSGNKFYNVENQSKLKCRSKIFLKINKATP